VTGVAVYIQRDGAGGNWWDSATSSWTVAPYPNPAVLASAGQDNTSWSATLPVPATGGSYEILASASSSGLADQTIGLSGPTQAISSFTVSSSDTATTFATVTTDVAPGSAVGVSGSGFAANEAVNVTLGGATLATITASSTGTLPATNVAIPGLTGFGPATLYATGTTSGKTAVAPIYVTNNWLQYGDTASHQASDLNDHVFERHLSVSPDTYLAPSWSFNAGSPISGSVVVDNGEGYVADQAGEVFAISTHTGLSTWSYQIADGELVDTTPALTPSGSLLLVASTDGSLTALRTVTGKVAWTAQIGGELEGSPSISGATAYVVSDSGTVTALSTSTGAQQWQVTLPSAVQTSPAVNAAGGVVYVADTAGTVYALTVTTGAASWSVPSLGTITASLTLGQGNVYVASQSGNVYALNETSGTTAWTYTDGSAMTASPAVLGGQIAIGGADGKIHMLNNGNGTATFSFSYGKPIVGISGAISFDTALLANGGIVGAKPTDSDPRAWQTANGTGFSGQPTVLDGEVFVAGENGMVTAYTVPGSPVY
jgi:outer membrane protein assembly factor BamB